MYLVYCIYFKSFWIHVECVECVELNYGSVCLSVCLAGCLSVGLSVCQSACAYVWMHCMHCMHCISTQCMHCMHSMNCINNMYQCMHAFMHVCTLICTHLVFHDISICVTTHLDQHVSNTRDLQTNQQTALGPWPRTLGTWQLARWSLTGSRKALVSKYTMLPGSTSRLLEPSGSVHFYGFFWREKPPSVFTNIVM